MSPQPNTRVRLLDVANESGRTTATLLASLAARLGTLHLVSGSTAVGSLVAGFARLGREVSATADGARLRRAIESNRGGLNGNLLWSALGIRSWASGSAASPVLDHLRNDLALLLADDLEGTLKLMPIPAEPAASREAEAAEDATFIDCTLGLWAYSAEIVRAVEALAAPTLEPQGTVTSARGPGLERRGSLLR